MLEAMLVIKKGNSKYIDTLRSNLITAEPSHDGVVFAFKDGIQLYCVDSYMPNHTKDLIRNTSNSFASASLTIDLLNYNKPVLAEATK